MEARSRVRIKDLALGLWTPGGSGGNATRRKEEIDETVDQRLRKLRQKIESGRRRDGRRSVETMATRIGHLLHRAPGASTPVPDDDHDANPRGATDADAAPSTPPHGAGRTVQLGDLVVVYEGFNRQKAVTVTEKGCYQNRYGNFHHREWVGKPYGSKVYGKGDAGFVWLLAPTPELWTKVLPHRTQILYLPDISLVCHALELKPGSVVLESGTGSGSLTHSLIRAVAPTGHVYTFEFNRVRAEAASAEIVDHGLADFCTVTHRDIEANGFPGELEDRCDAAFLDLPGPWKCIPSVAKCLRPDGVVCSFSPCIEQVQRCCEALEANGFGDCQTVELLGREYDVEARELQRDLALAQPKLSSRWKREAKEKARRKRKHVDGGDGDGDGDRGGDVQLEPKPVVVAHPRQEAQHHTGYLTFARLSPLVTGEMIDAARAAGGGGTRRRGGGGYDEDELSE